eukprot:403371447
MNKYISVKSLSLLIFVLSFQSIFAIQTYDKCIDCLSKNRTGAYYCQTNQMCLPTKSPQCATSQMVLKYHQCVEGFAACQNMTFTEYSAGQTQEQGYGLLPGYGCFIKIDRLETGTIGSVQIIFDDPAIKIIDDYNKKYTSGQLLIASYQLIKEEIMIIGTF